LLKRKVNNGNFRGRYKVNESNLASELRNFTKLMNQILQVNLETYLSIGSKDYNIIFGNESLLSLWVCYCNGQSEQLYKVRLDLIWPSINKIQQFCKNNSNHQLKTIHIKTRALSLNNNLDPKLNSTKPGEKERMTMIKVTRSEP